MALANSLTCVDPNISLDQLLLSILYKQSSAANAITGLLTTLVDVDTDEIVSVAACGGLNPSSLNILRMAFGLDDDGDTTLVLFVKTP